MSRNFRDKDLRERKFAFKATFSLLSRRWIIIGTLRSNEAYGNENVKKTIGFISKTTTFHVHHAFLYITLPVCARLRREHA